MGRDQSLVERYRERAAQIRNILDAMPPSSERDLLVQVAADYDELASAARILDQANRPHTDS